MGNRYIVFWPLAVMLSSSGCGFKSDLFLPNELESAGQFDSNATETLKQRTLDTLQDQTPGGVELQIGGATEALTPADSVPVVVDPLSAEEIKKNRDKNNLP